MLWLHECLQEKCSGWAPLKDDDPDYEIRAAEDKLITGLFRFVFFGPDETTSELLDCLLKSIRPTLVALDRDWAKN